MTPTSPGLSGSGSSKTCRKCERLLPLTAFGVHGNTADGLALRCKPCRAQNARVQDRARRVANPEAEMVRRARARAAKHGAAFNITKADIHIPNRCPVLGIPLAAHAGRSGENSPSLDKIVPSLGYTRGNIEVLSARANRLKGDATLAEIEALHEWMLRRVAPAPIPRKRKRKP